jgi:indolepyruvate ferredoxin oxidoreductase
MTAAAVERAIALNGVAVDRNTAAFRWGRAQIAVPEQVAAAVATREDPGPAAIDLAAGLDDRIEAVAGDDEALRSLLTMLAADLVGYQNRSIADDYLATLDEVASREREVLAGSTRLTAAVARGLHKLTAYKDEYEVARLMLHPDGVAEARSLAQATGGRISWQLHPPALRAMGRSSKIAFGSWTTPLFRVLRRMKWLRGRRLDPFGHTQIRRTERALAGEYLTALRTVLDGLDVSRLDDAVALAELPELVRGYEDIKMRRVSEFRDRLERAVAGFR